MIFMAKTKNIILQKKTNTVILFTQTFGCMNVKTENGVVAYTTEIEWALLKDTAEREYPLWTAQQSKLKKGEIGYEK